MLPPNTEGLKMMFLEDIALLSKTIRSFVNETYRIAEEAANQMFAEKDVLSNAVTHVLKVKECRQKLAAVAAAIPSETVKPPPASLCVPLDKNKQGSALPIHQIIPLSVTYGIPHPVKLLHQGTPTRFWLQFENSLYSEIENSLKPLYSHAKPLNIIPTLGSYVICKQASQFYRGKVVTSYLDQDKGTEVGIILVDTGETVEVGPNEIYEIHETCCRQPAQGLLCSIHDLEPANEEWEIDAVLFFISLCENLVATFHPPPPGARESFSKDESDFFVTLHTMKDGKSVDVSSIMIQERMALSKTKQLQHASSIVSELRNSAPIHPNSTNDTSVALKSSKEISQCFQLQQVQDSRSTPRNLTPAPANTINSPSVQIINETLTNSWLKETLAKETTPSQHFLAPTQVVRTPLSKMCNQESNDINNYEPPVTLSSKQSFVSLKTDTNGNAPFHPNTNIKRKDDVEELIDPSPLRQTGEDSCFIRPADMLLMQQFLNSLPNTAAPSTSGLDDSFVTARSFSLNQVHLNEEPFPHSKYLQYEYGAFLKPRALPLMESSPVNYLKFTVSQIYSPTHFYVLPEDDVAILQDLTEVLREKYENSNPVPVLHPDVGSFWVTRSEIQECWARVKVIKVKECEPGKSGDFCENTCHVFLVDLGVFETVRVSTLRPLVREVLDISCIALRCRMVGIYPYSCSPHAEDWSEEASEKFKELVSFEFESTALIHSVDEEQETVSVILLYNNSEENYSINEMLVGLRLASSEIFKQFDEVSEKMTEDHNVTTDEAWDDWNPMAEDFRSAKNTLQIDPENYDSVTVGYVPQDEKRICRFFRAQGFCQRGIRCNQLHIQPQPNNFTEDKSLVYVNVPSLPRMPIGGLLSVQITCVMNAFRLFAILPHGARDLRGTTSILDENHNLEHLQIELQKEYNQAQQKHRCAILPTLGDIIIARSPEDNKWYRARVVEDNQHDYYVVFFIDFGNQQEVHMRNICNPLPRFMHLPAQAVEMYLNGIERSGDNCSAEARNALIQLVKERDLVARIIFDEPYVCVDLYDTSGEKQIDIAAYLVEKKFVRPAPKESPAATSSLMIVAG